MSSDITKQLIKEIEKLKEGDYTSYQKFYNETSDYLYQIIWNNVQDRNVADELINELYTDIYVSIGTELTDNSQFYVWAGNKAQILSTTYLTTYNTAGVQGLNANGYRIEGAAMVAAANMGMDVAGEVADAVGAGVAEEIAIDAGWMGVGSAANGMGQLGMGSVANGIGQMGVGATSANMSAGGLATQAAVSMAKVGMGLGAKIGIGIASVALLVSGGIAVHHFTSNASNEPEQIITEKASEIEETTEIVTEEVTTEEETTEEIIEKDNKTMYLDYVRDVLLPMYGFADLSYKLKGDADINNWVNYDGLISVHIEDLDLDGEEEMLVSRIESGILTQQADKFNQITITLYSIEGDDVVEKDNISSTTWFGDINNPYQNIYEERLGVHATPENPKYILASILDSTNYGRIVHVKNCTGWFGSEAMNEESSYRIKDKKFVLLHHREDGDDYNHGNYVYDENEQIIDYEVISAYEDNIDALTLSSLGINVYSGFDMFELDCNLEDNIYMSDYMYHLYTDINDFTYIRTTLGYEE